MRMEPAIVFRLGINCYDYAAGFVPLQRLRIPTMISCGCRMWRDIAIDPGDTIAGPNFENVRLELERFDLNRVLSSEH